MIGYRELLRCRVAASKAIKVLKVLKVFGGEQDEQHTFGSNPRQETGLMATFSEKFRASSKLYISLVE